VTLPGQQSLTYSGTVHVTGTSQGRLLWCDQPFSFWGGVDPTTGEIIDRFHPLRGRHLKDTVFVMPGSKGILWRQCHHFGADQERLGPKGADL
jgi:hypothetical protein